MATTHVHKYVVKILFSSHYLTSCKFILWFWNSGNFEVYLASNSYYVSCGINHL